MDILLVWLMLLFTGYIIGDSASTQGFIITKISHSDMKAVPKENNMKRRPEMIENDSKTVHLELWVARGPK